MANIGSHGVQGIESVRTAIIIGRRPLKDGLAMLGPKARGELVIFVLDVQYHHRVRPGEQIGNDHADTFAGTSGSSH